MTFSEYVDLMRQQALPREDSDAPTQTSTPYATLLNQRFMRNLQSYVVSADLKKAMAEIRESQVWMILTEPWCGDSCQLIPIIARIAECNSLVKLNLVLRDSHPEMMDAYLTGGKRSIPKLVAFDAGHREIFRWGPRPRRAQDLFEQTVKEGRTKQDALERVHLFYAKDKGKAVDEEFLEIMRGKGRD